MPSFDSLIETSNLEKKIERRRGRGGGSEEGGEGEHASKGHEGQWIAMSSWW